MWWHWEEEEKLPFLVPLLLLLLHPLTFTAFSFPIPSTLPRTVLCFVVEALRTVALTWVKTLIICYT
jgi:hypothetical protein